MDFKRSSQLKNKTPVCEPHTHTHKPMRRHTHTKTLGQHTLTHTRTMTSLYWAPRTRQ